MAKISLFGLGCDGKRWVWLGSWLGGTCIAAAMGLLSSSARAQNVPLFTTSSDWSGSNWTAPTGGAVTAVAPSATYDYDGSTTNGLGNLSAGATSTAASLQISFNGTSSIGYSQIAYGPGEAFNTAFMTAIDPGSVAAYTAASNYGPGSTAAYSGKFTLAYTIPTVASGSYFQVGAFLNYDGHGYTPLLGSASLIGTVDGMTTYVATIPYTIAAGSLTYFNLNIFANSDYVPTSPIYVDDYSVVPAPEPSSLGLLIGSGGLILKRRPRSL